MKKKGPFFRMGLWLADIFIGSKMEKAIRVKIRETLCSLAPMERGDILVRNFYGEQLGLCLLLIVVGLGLWLFYFIFGEEGKILHIGGRQGVQIPFKAAIFFLVIIEAYIFAKRKSDLEKALKEREKQLRMDYPKIVIKLTMLFSAGLTIGEAWEKIVNFYIRQRENGNTIRYAYEEMLLAYREMQGGMSEGEVYNRFGRRCKLSGYMKLSALLVQNLKKGNEGLSQMLAYEGAQALEERKSLAKKLGEEADTKMLLPMLLMLAIVIVILLVPAFMTIQF